MNEIILCKLGEVVLKGLNRRSFEMKLMSNIRRRTARFGKFRIYSKQSTIYVEPAEETCDLSGAYAACKQVFGIIAIARAVPCPKEKEAILATAKTYLGEALTAARSFKVESKRADKSFPMSSIQLSQWVGGELHEAYPHLKVDVHHPELTVYVEVREDAAYVHAPAEPAAGGLPIGMGGRAVSLLSGGIDSPVASYMMAKRGVQLEMIHFASPPYTSEQAREKVLQLARELVPWCGRLTVHVVPFAEIQEEIRRSCPEDHFTLIMRRFMMRLADALAHELGCGALVTGECLGQVGNAIKYNVPDGAVKVQVSSENGISSVTVSDTGIGIAPEHQSRVFERFYRVDKSHSKASGGTGLGLSIVKHAVQYHHGDIRLTSKPGEGTVIRITFPAAAR